MEKHIDPTRDFKGCHTHNHNIMKESTRVNKSNIKF